MEGWHFLKDTVNQHLLSQRNRLCLVSVEKSSTKKAWVAGSPQGRQEEVSSQAARITPQCSLDSAPQLAGHCCCPGDHLSLRHHQDGSPGPHFFQSEDPASEYQVSAPSEGARETGLEPVASLLGGELCLAPRFIEQTVPQAQEEAEMLGSRKGEMSVRGGPPA